VKFLRNPWVTGALSLAAVGVVCLQIFQGKAPRASAGGETPPVPAIAPAVPQKNASSSPEAIQPRANEIVGTAIDRRYAQAHLSEWIDQPRTIPAARARRRSR
jgi:hypothetical protein